ncbi:MAG: carbohydrate-binding domain-containing protein, partial [Bacillota bacterium]
MEYSQFDWGSGATVSVTIINKGTSAIDGWTLSWTYSGNQKITNIWNGTYTQSGSAITVTNQIYNATIPANGSVSFGFNISYSGTNDKPTSFSLNGATVGSSASPSATPTATPTATATTTASTSPTPTAGSDDAWKDNQGEITLGTTITYSGTGVTTNGSTVKISDGGDFTVTGTLTDGQIYVDTTEKVKLRLSEVSITNTTGPAIYIANADKAFITLTEGTSNTLTDGSNYINSEAKATIFSNDDLEIKGSGSLTIAGKYKHAICCDDDLTIENGNITVTSAVTDGIHVNDTIEVNGGTIKITATSDCFESENADMVINDGTLTLAAGSDGVQTATDFTVNGGTINVTKAVEGLESKANLIINDGTINVVASEDGLNSKTGLTINGGTTTLTVSRGDGVDTAGPLN